MKPTSPASKYAARRKLQWAIFLGGFVPVAAGLAGVLEGPSAFGGAAPASAGTDGHFQYLSGLLFAIGLSFWLAVPNIERKTMMIRSLGFLVVVGGFSRLSSLLTDGAPGRAMLFALAMELVVTPALVVWQGAVAKRFSRCAEISPTKP